VTVTAIVLAGGRSSRFGGDKLAASLEGASVLAATIAAVAPIAEGVIVAGPRLPECFVAGDVPVALVTDPEPVGGPLLALASVLGAGEPAPWDVAIVVGGDMPRLVPAVLVAMVDLLDEDPDVGAVYLGRPEAPTSAAPLEPPRRQVLPLAVRVQQASRAAREAAEAGDRSLQALVERMTTVELPAARWQLLDPDARTLTDIDTRADLDRLNVP
jgi:molybdenum cofactor guanylyltransferase